MLIFLFLVIFFSFIAHKWGASSSRFTYAVVTVLFILCFLMLAFGNSKSDVSMTFAIVFAFITTFSSAIIAFLLITAVEFLSNSEPRNVAKLERAERKQQRNEDHKELENRYSGYGRLLAPARTTACEKCGLQYPKAEGECFRCGDLESTEIKYY